MNRKYWITLYLLYPLLVLSNAGKLIDKTALNNNIASIIHRFFGPEKVVIHIPVEILKSLNNTSKYVTTASSYPLSFPYKFEVENMHESPGYYATEGLNTGETVFNPYAHTLKESQQHSQQSNGYALTHAPISVTSKGEGKYFTLEHNQLKEVVYEDVLRHYQGYKNGNSDISAPAANFATQKPVSSVKPIPVYKLLGFKLGDSNIDALQVIDVKSPQKTNQGINDVDFSNLKIKNTNIYASQNSNNGHHNNFQTVQSQNQNSPSKNKLQPFHYETLSGGYQSAGYLNNNHNSQYNNNGPKFVSNNVYSLPAVNINPHNNYQSPPAGPSLINFGQHNQQNNNKNYNGPQTASLATLYESNNDQQNNKNYNQAPENYMNPHKNDYTGPRVAYESNNGYNYNRRPSVEYIEPQVTENYHHRVPENNNQAGIIGNHAATSAVNYESNNNYNQATAVEHTAPVVNYNQGPYHSEQHQINNVPLPTYSNSNNYFPSHGYSAIPIHTDSNSVYQAVAQQNQNKQPTRNGAPSDEAWSVPIEQFNPSSTYYDNTHHSTDHVQEQYSQHLDIPDLKYSYLKEVQLNGQFYPSHGLPSENQKETEKLLVLIAGQNGNANTETGYNNADEGQLNGNSYYSPDDLNNNYAYSAYAQSDNGHSASKRITEQVNPPNRKKRKPANTAVQTGVQSKNTVGIKEVENEEESEFVRHNLTQSSGSIKSGRLSTEFEYESKGNETVFGDDQRISASLKTQLNAKEESISDQKTNNTVDWSLPKTVTYDVRSISIVPEYPDLQNSTTTAAPVDRQNTKFPLIFEGKNRTTIEST